MSIENPLNNNKQEEQALMVSGIDKEGVKIYEPIQKPLGFREIPVEVFRKVIEDFKTINENDIPLNFKQKEMVFVAINSDKKAHYQIGDARKGHYFMVKSQIDSNNTQSIQVELSKDPRVIPNPEIIVCSSDELES